MELIQDSLRQQQSIMNSRGQSTIEFLATFSFSLLFVFLFFKMALNFTNSYLVQFATFQASRAYLVYDTGLAVEQDVNFSQSVFNKYTNLISGAFKTAPSFGIREAGSANNEKALYIGAYSEYTDIFSFSDTMGGKKDVTFKSESYIGKEPGRSACKLNICEISMSGDLKSFCEDKVYVTHYDNGC